MFKCSNENYKTQKKNIARGTTDPGIVSITWIRYKFGYHLVGKFGTNAGSAI